MVEDAVCVTTYENKERKDQSLNAPFKGTPSMPKLLLLSPLSEILPSFNSTVHLWETFYIQNTEVNNSFKIPQVNILERWNVIFPTISGKVGN